MSELHQHTVTSQDLHLNVIEAGTTDGPPLLFLHGLRDSAHALLPMASKHLSAYRLLFLEHRGHGKSETTSAYAMHNFILDAYAVAEHFSCSTLGVFGHSLGGHIATKFAALFPERVSALIVAEGFGPPTRPYMGDETAELAAYKQSMLSRTQRPPSRVIPDHADATRRLLRNNPRLDPDSAAELAPYLVRPVEGGYAWNWDPVANSVFVGTSHEENKKFWRHVTAPTCVISGSLSYEYWGSQFSEDGFDGRFAEGEMETRVAEFANAEHHWFDRSGHMVHYDEPDRLGELCASFFGQHLHTER